MRSWTIIYAVGFAILLAGSAGATVVDTTRAEELFQSGDYAAAHDEFTTRLEEFRKRQADSEDYRSYRELAYIYDRLMDCSFTHRDWQGVFDNANGLLVVSDAELNLVEGQLSGALFSGVAPAALRYLYDRVDEAVRLNSAYQLKRSIALVLYDTGGQGETGEVAIKQYQAMAKSQQRFLSAPSGYYEANIARLEEEIDNLSAIDAALNEVADLPTLWEQYPPGKKRDDTSAAE